MKVEDYMGHKSLVDVQHTMVPLAPSAEVKMGYMDHKDLSMTVESLSHRVGHHNRYTVPPLHKVQKGAGAEV
jgi:hypothetical protein